MSINFWSTIFIFISNHPNRNRSQAFKPLPNLFLKLENCNQKPETYAPNTCALVPGAITSNHLICPKSRPDPSLFMFQLTLAEKEQLVPIWHQFKTRKHTYTLPYAFTEHGITMLSAVLNSEKAIMISIMVVKTFIKLRKIITTNKELAEKLKELDQKVNSHDKDIILIFQAINKLMAPLPPPLPEEPKRRIGFKT